MLYFNHRKKDYLKKIILHKEKATQYWKYWNDPNQVLIYGLIVAYFISMFNVVDFKSSGDKLRDKAKPVALLSS